VSTATVDGVEVRSPDGTIIGCEVFGDGPPLLVIHGTTADHRRWEPVRDGLAESFRVHLMDRRGRGLSGDGDGPYALEREVEDIRAVLDAIGGAVLVLAHSYGGLCMLEAAVDNERVERLLVYEPAFGTDTPPPLWPADGLEELNDAVTRGDREAATTIFFKRGIELDDETVAQMRETPEWQYRLEAALTLARECETANAFRLDPERWARIGAPTRFLLGTATTQALKNSTRAAHEAVPGSELRELPGHGHTAMVADQPMFVREVRDWLSPQADRG
jgi:pimeloyl-ACP methyl ester carboxylesterase